MSLAYTPELILNPDNPLPIHVLICQRSPLRQWLQDGAVVGRSGNPSLPLSPADTGGIYQCVGMGIEQQETDYTGEVGSDIYLLVPGMLVHKGPERMGTDPRASSSCLPMVTCTHNFLCFLLQLSVPL